MKQSKKILSIFLAMLMMLSMFSVVGQAANGAILNKSTLKYDSIDNAALTPEQVAETIFDMLDAEVMPGLGTIEIPVLGDLDLTSIDNAFSSIVDLLGNGTLGFLAGGDAQDLIDERTRLCVNGDKNNPYSRADGDLECAYALLDFIGNDAVAEVLSHATGGLLVDGGVDIGGLTDLVSGLVDLDEINAILQNLDSYLVGMLYDMLLYGSYPYPDDLEALGGTVPSEVNTLDKLLDTTVYNFLTVPQEYTWVDTGADDAEGNAIMEKVWDEDSIIVDSSKLAGLELGLASNSVFSLIDKLIQIAYEDFGTVVINHDLKKVFMEAMDVEFVEVTDAAELAKIKADPDYIDVDTAADVSSVKNFLCNAQMWKVGDTWYFRDYVTRDVVINGEVQKDPDGNTIREKQHRFQKAVTYNVSDLYKVFNFDYVLDDATFNFNDMIPKYGSIVGCLNHMVYVILSKAINADYLKSVGISNISTIWADGDNSNFNENVVKTAKFVLENFAFEFFGRNAEYVDLNTLQANATFKANLAKCSTIESLVAYIGLPFLADALPQLVYEDVKFTEGLQIEQLAALLVREFLSDLTPQINYDSEIFVDATLKTGRVFKEKTSAQWMELVLNMGLDLAAVYLDNIANFNVDLDTLATLKANAVAAGDPAYMGVLEEIIDWAISYVGSGSNSVLKGLDPATLGSARSVTAYDDKTDTVTLANNYAGNAFTMLSQALNTILPLGLLCNVSSESYALDVKMLFDRIINVVDDLDLEVLLATFGRNGRTDNLLGATNIGAQLFGLVNKLLGCVFGKTLLQLGSGESTLHTAISDASLSTTIKNLVTGLNSRKVALLRSALPVVAVFVEDWGIEQKLRSPNLGIEETIFAEDGTLNQTITLSNGSKGLWRGYMNNGTRVQDEMYSYEIISIVPLFGSVTVGGSYTGEVEKGSLKSVTLTGSVPTAGVVDRLDITYQIRDEDGALMENGKNYVKSYWFYASYDKTGEQNILLDQDNYNFWVDKAVLVGDQDLDDLATEQIGTFRAETSGDGKTYYFQAQGTTSQNGITLNNNENTDCDADSNYSFNGFTFDETQQSNEIPATGAEYTFQYQFWAQWKSWGSTKKAGFTSNTDIKVRIFSSELMGEIRGLVNDETSLARESSDYKDATAYNNYITALKNAIAVAWHPLNSSTVFNLDIEPTLTALENAITALEATKKTPQEIAAAAAGATVSGAIATLSSQLDASSDYLNGKDYRTFMMYRWDRYKSARNDARYVVELQDKFNAGVVTQKFAYNSAPLYEIKEAISGDKNASYITALFENLNEEETAIAKEDYKNVQSSYSSYTTLDIAQMSNLLTRMRDRLLPREGGVVNTYLQKEIDSAKAVIGSTNTKGWSEKSWNRYATALANAEAALTNASQDSIFNAKYELQVARNNLRTTATEADYTELNSLIAQAEAVLKGASNYSNSAADFGRLLAALGYKTADGYDVFPNGAKNIVDKSFDKGDQDELDDKSLELKKALSKMVFNNTNYGSASSSVTTTTAPTGETDAEGNQVKEEIKTATITAEQALAAVKSKFAATTATGAASVEVKISLDGNYTLDNKADTFVGTGATITIYTTVGGVSVPVSTMKVVVEGDVTGDGVIDVLDCMVVELVKSNNTTINGVYNVAGDIGTKDGAIDLTDYQAVVNKAKA